MGQRLCIQPTHPVSSPCTSIYMQMRTEKKRLVCRERCVLRVMRWAWLWFEMRHIPTLRMYVKVRGSLCRPNYVVCVKSLCEYIICARFSLSRLNAFARASFSRPLSIITKILKQTVGTRRCWCHLVPCACVLARCREDVYGAVFTPKSFCAHSSTRWAKFIYRHGRRCKKSNLSRGGRSFRKQPAVRPYLKKRRFDS